METEPSEQLPPSPQEGSVKAGKLLLPAQGKTNDPKRVKWKILNNPHEDFLKRLGELEKLVHHTEDRQRFSGFVELGGLVSLAHWLKEAAEQENYNTITRILSCLNYDSLDLSLADLDKSNLGEQVLSLQQLPFQKTKVLVHELSERWKRMITTSVIKKKSSSKKKVKFADEKQLQLRILNTFSIHETIMEFHTRLQRASRRFEEQVQWSAPQAWVDPRILEAFRNFSSTSEEQMNFAKRNESVETNLEQLNALEPSDGCAAYDAFLCKEVEMQSRIEAEPEAPPVAPLAAAAVATPGVSLVNALTTNLLESPLQQQIPNTWPHEPPHQPNPQMNQFMGFPPPQNPTFTNPPPQPKPAYSPNHNKSNKPSAFASRARNRSGEGFRSRGRTSFRERERQYENRNRGVPRPIKQKATSGKFDVNHENRNRGVPPPRNNQKPKIWPQNQKPNRFVITRSPNRSRPKRGPRQIGRGGRKSRSRSWERTRPKGNKW